MIDQKKVIEGLEEVEIKLTNALNRSGTMSLTAAHRCLNNVTDALALLKEQEEEIKRLKGKLRGFCAKYDGKEKLKGCPQSTTW